MTSKLWSELRATLGKIATGAAMGALWGAFALLRPALRGRGWPVVAQWAFIGGLTFLLRHFLADISKESPTKYYAVWSVSLTISLVISALPDILRGGAFEAPLVILIVAGLVGGLIFGAAFKKAGFD